MQAVVTPAKYNLADYNLGKIKHQAMFAGGLHHQSYISRVVLGFSNFTVLSLGSITSLMLLSRAVHVALASFAPSPSFPLDAFGKYLHIFLH